MAFSRIIQGTPELQKVQDATARALRTVPPATPAPVSALLEVDASISAVSWADVAGLSVEFVAKRNERVLVCVTGCLVGSTELTVGVGGVDVEVGGNGLKAGAGAIGIAYLTSGLAAGLTKVSVRAYAVSGTTTLMAPAQLSVIRFGVAW